MRWHYCYPLFIWWLRPKKDKNFKTCKKYILRNTSNNVRPLIISAPKRKKIVISADIIRGDTVLGRFVPSEVSIMYQYRTLRSVHTSIIKPTRFSLLSQSWKSCLWAFFIFFSLVFFDARNSSEWTTNELIFWDHLCSRLSVLLCIPV